MLTHPLTILINFIQNPADFSRDNTKVNINKHIFAYVFFGITATVFLNLVIFLVTPSQHSDIQSKIDISRTYDFFNIAILAVLLAPFYEEFIFRGLVSRSSLQVKRVFLCLVILVLFALLTNFAPVSTQLFGVWKLLAPIPLIIIAVLIAFLAPIDKLYNPIPYNILVHFQAFCFAIIHINNSQFNSSKALLIIPFLIINQLYLGYVHAYLASRFGITKAILSHFINNFIGVGALAASTLIENKWIAITSGILALFMYTYAFFCFITITINSYKNSKNRNFPVIMDINNNINQD
jgi:membrane protease YdiL (CAAX protease family)